MSRVFWRAKGNSRREVRKEELACAASTSLARSFHLRRFRLLQTESVTHGYLQHIEKSKSMIKENAEKENSGSLA